VFSSQPFLKMTLKDTCYNIQQTSAVKGELLHFIMTYGARA